MFQQRGAAIPAIGDKMTKLEDLSKRKREETPPAFAHYLVNKLRNLTGNYKLAALWVREDTVYNTIDGIECYPLSRNAYTYRGPYPVICHPPCGPWGAYAHYCYQDKGAGLVAIEMAREWQGVIEQPYHSRLFTGGEYIEQGNYGHLVVKPTRLLWIVK